METKHHLTEDQNETRLDAEKQQNGKKRQMELESNVIQLGVRELLMNPISACERIDRLFGSGGEAIAHYMLFECGRSLFDNMLKINPRRTREELLNRLIAAQPDLGWGKVSIRIIGTTPHIIDVVVRNPPVKSVMGSPKHLIGSFWAGVFSKYFKVQLVCKNFEYDVDKDEFSCTITTSEHK